MTVATGDPLRDPRFPDRPQHPDFWRLSESALLLDGRTDSGQSVDKAMSEYVDPESALYVVQQRTDAFLVQMGYTDPPTSLKLLLRTAMLSGLVHGIVFEKHGGHREP